MKTKIIAFFTLLTLFATVIVSAQSTVSGTISYHNDPGKPLEDVMVSLIDTSGVAIDSCLTNSSGYYAINNVPAGIYTMNCTTTQNAGGIDLADSFLIFKHLMGWYTLSPMEFLAADVDGDGDVTWIDYWTIVIGWFVHGYPFPAGDWVFNTPTVVVQAQMKDGTANGGGTSTGDVDGSFQPGTKPNPTLSLVYAERISISPNQQIEIPVYCNWDYPLAGVALSIGIPHDLLHVDYVLTDLKDMNYKVKDDQLRVSWIDTKFTGLSLNSDDPLFVIVGTTTQGFVNEEISFLLGNQSHLMDSKGHIVEEAELYMPRITSSHNEMSVAVYPNPIRNIAKLDYTLEKDCRVQMKIINPSGQLMGELLNEFQGKGLYTREINVKDFNLKPGYYFITIELDDSNLVGNVQKLVIIN